MDGSWLDGCIIVCLGRSCRSGLGPPIRTHNGDGKSCFVVAVSSLSSKMTDDVLQRKVLVSGIRPNVDDDTLICICESKRHKGGEVAFLERSQSGTSAFVTFKDASGNTMNISFYFLLVLTFVLFKVKLKISRTTSKAPYKLQQYFKGAHANR